MGKIIIPIADHVSGLHKGHLGVIDFAKEFSGIHTMKVIKDAKRWRNHLITGASFVPTDISKKMRDDLNKTGMIVEEANIKPIPEEWRATMYRKANALVSLYDDAILIDEYKSRAILVIMGLFAFKYTTIDRNDIFVRGPDLVSFFQNSVRKLIGGPEIKIYPHIIKNEKTKIREQGSLDNVSAHYYPYILRLRGMIDGAAPYFRPGKNHDLVIELNHAYAGKPWKIQAIAIYEGGMVQGRLETVLISFPSDTGTTLIEESNYYN